MKAILSLLQFLIFLSLISGLSFAQSLDSQQIHLIKQTAADICNTVKEAKGTKSNIEIEGDVEAKLKGLTRKLADVGISGNGMLNIENFDGLSQEATASLMEGDRQCRERIFNLMFNKIHPLPNDQETIIRTLPESQIVRSVMEGEIFQACGVSDLILTGSHVGRSIACLGRKDGVFFSRNGGVLKDLLINMNVQIRLSADCFITITDVYSVQGITGYMLLIERENK